MTVFDIETDGLLEEATKIHVLCWMDKGELNWTHDYDRMRKFFTEADTLVGHNIIRFDIPVVEKLLVSRSRQSWWTHWLCLGI